MQNYDNEKGSTTVTILLIIMLVIIGVLIYILAGGPTPKFSGSVGVQSPEIKIDNEQAYDIETGNFNDGLIKPNFSETYELNEFGEGVAQKEIFDQDINGDGRNDRITKTKYENGTAHYYYTYKIELNQNGVFVDITPDDFKTIEGADCSLQKLQFIFTPDFRVKKISRDWQDSWTTPTMAIQTTYALTDNSLQPINSKKLKEICNVAELF